MAIDASQSIVGTSTKTPTMVENAAPNCNPHKLIATATANSKKIAAQISPAGAAITLGIYLSNVRTLNSVDRKGSVL